MSRPQTSVIVDGPTLSMDQHPHCSTRGRLRVGALAQLKVTRFFILEI
jgi:hypothetical protein